MSRSYKKNPIVKDGPKDKSYNRIIRHHQTQQINNIKSLKDVDEYEIDDPKSIVNQYDVCDYKIYDDTNDKFLRK